MGERVDRANAQHIDNKLERAKAKLQRRAEELAWEDGATQEVSRLELQRAEIDGELKNAQAKVKVLDKVRKRQELAVKEQEALNAQQLDGEDAKRVIQARSEELAERAQQQQGSQGGGKDKGAGLPGGVDMAELNPTQNVSVKDPGGAVGSPGAPDLQGGLTVGSNGFPQPGSPGQAGAPQQAGGQVGAGLLQSINDPEVTVQQGERLAPLGRGSTMSIPTQTTSARFPGGVEKAELLFREIHRQQAGARADRELAANVKLAEARIGESRANRFASISSQFDNPANRVKYFHELESGNIPGQVAIEAQEAKSYDERVALGRRRDEAQIDANEALTDFRRAQIGALEVEGGLHRMIGKMVPDMPRPEAALKELRIMLKEGITDKNRGLAEMYQEALWGKQFRHLFISDNVFWDGQTTKSVPVEEIASHLLTLKNIPNMWTGHQDPNRDHKRVAARALQGLGITVSSPHIPNSLPGFGVFMDRPQQTDENQIDWTAEWDADITSMEFAEDIRLMRLTGEVADWMAQGYRDNNIVPHFDASVSNAERFSSRKKVTRTAGREFGRTIAETGRRFDQARRDLPGNLLGAASGVGEFFGDVGSGITERSGEIADRRRKVEAARQGGR